jgi:hypothetical protein
MHFNRAANTGASSLCPSANQYTLAGATICRTCPANAIAVPTKDGCMCKDGYAPKPTTSSLDGSLECVACPGGTYARAGDQNCTKCPEKEFSGVAASACIKCRPYVLGTSLTTFAVIQTNSAQTDCVCVRTSAPIDLTCSTEGSGAFATCNCTVTNNSRGSCVGQCPWFAVCSYCLAAQTFNCQLWLIWFG